jgi:hypothetical protein
MEPKNTQIENQENQLDNALTIVELEERFELTVAAAEADRCTISDVSLS